MPDKEKKMKYVRFMGKEELKKYINGETLINIDPRITTVTLIP